MSFTEELLREGRTSIAMVVPIVVEHLGECPPTDEGLCVGCKHRTHGYAIPRLLEKMAESLWTVGCDGGGR